MTTDDWRLSDFEKRRILATMGGVDASVMTEIEKMMRKYWQEWDRHESRYVHPTVKEVRGKTMLFPDRRRHESKGKPNRNAVRALVTALIQIYDDATGKHLGRINITGRAVFQRYKTLATHKSKRIPFIEACVHAIGRRYPSRIIQEVLEELHPDAKLGRPAKKTHRGLD
jgi:hypothetical protein